MKALTDRGFHRRRVVAAAVVLGVAITSACATVPYTRRTQLNLMSAEQERVAGERLYTEMRKKTPVSKNAEATRVLGEVGRRIAAASGQPEWDWDFTLFRDKQVNAWALPGGKVGVYTGLLPAARTEAGLATVVAHEVAHAIAHHGAERASQAQLLSIVGNVGAAAAGSSMDSGTLNALMTVYGVGAQVGVLLPFGRGQESEADEIGLILMAKAGYDPREALALWERMEAVGKKTGRQAPPEFLSTHPSYGTRVGRIRESLPVALRYYDGSNRGQRLLPGIG